MWLILTKGLSFLVLVVWVKLMSWSVVSLLPDWMYLPFKITSKWIVSYIFMVSSVSILTDLGLVLTLIFSMLGVSLLTFLLKTWLNFLSYLKTSVLGYTLSLLSVTSLSMLPISRKPNMVVLLMIFSMSNLSKLFLVVLIINLLILSWSVLGYAYLVILIHV